MQLRQLEYFVALARERHFARAAAACHVSQPALSNALARLEAELGVPLVVRDHTFLRLTPEGEALLERAGRVVAEADSLRDEAAALRSGVEGTLLLGTSPTAAPAAALAVDTFARSHPRASVRMVEHLSAPDIRRRLLAFELHAGLSYFAPEDRAGLSTLRLYSDPLVLVSTAALLPGAPATIGWAAAAALPLALLNPATRIRQTVDRSFAAAGARPSVRLEADSIEAIALHLREGPLATILPRRSASVLGSLDGVRVTPLIGPAVEAPVGLAVAARTAETALVRAFVAAARSIDWTTLDGPAAR